MYYVIGKPNCPYCDKAKTLLEAKGMDYIYEDLSEQPDLLTLLRNMGVRTVPAIFEFKGGFDNLQAELHDIGDEV
jgi:glutaredoxin